MGMTFATLRSSGTHSVDIDILKIVSNGFERLCLKVFRIKGGMLQGPTALLADISSIISSISADVQGEKYILDDGDAPRNDSGVDVVGETVLLRVEPISAKKLLKLLAISMTFVIALQSS